MAEYTFGDLIDTAASVPATGGGERTNDDIEVPDGRYPATVVYSNSEITAKGKLKVGLKFRIDGGDCDGGGVWGSQYLSPESPAAVEIWFKTFEVLGLPREDWKQFGNRVSEAGAWAATEVKGAEVEIVVKADDYGPKVQYVNRRKASKAGVSGAVSRPTPTETRDSQPRKSPPNDLPF